jgi:hypothetical protein
MSSIQRANRPLARTSYMDDEDRLNDAIGEIERLRAEMRLDLAIQEIVKLAELLQTQGRGNGDAAKIRRRQGLFE